MLFTRSTGSLKPVVPVVSVTIISQKYDFTRSSLLTLHDRVTLLPTTVTLGPMIITFRGGPAEIEGRGGEGVGQGSKIGRKGQKERRKWVKRSGKMHTETLCTKIYIKIALIRILLQHHLMWCTERIQKQNGHLSLHIAANVFRSLINRTNQVIAFYAYIRPSANFRPKPPTPQMYMHAHVYAVHTYHIDGDGFRGTPRGVLCCASVVSYFFRANIYERQWAVVLLITSRNCRCSREQRDIGRGWPSNSDIFNRHNRTENSDVILVVCFNSLRKSSHHWWGSYGKKVAAIDESAITPE